MTLDQYHAALDRLNLKPAAKATAFQLGISVRHAQRIAAGHPVPATVARVLELMLAARQAAPSE